MFLRQVLKRLIRRKRDREQTPALEAGVFLAMNMDISKITEQLYVGTQPRKEEYKALRDLGIRLVINMRAFHPSRKDGAKDPIIFRQFKTFDVFFAPIPLAVLQMGVVQALATMECGEKVLVHCRAGKHRSVAMACAILIGQGCTAKEAMQRVKIARIVADPSAWHIRRQIRRFEVYWKRMREQ